MRSRASLEVLTSGLAGLAGLVVPVWCPGCGRPDVPVCPTCRAGLDVTPRRVRPPLWPPGGVPGGVPVWAGPDYGGAVSHLVVAWKDRGRHDLTGALSAVLARVLDAAAPRPGARPVIVPLPSSRRAVLRRGDDLVAVLARAALRRTAAADGAVVRVVLRQRGGVRDQAGLTAAERWTNLRGGLALRAGRGRRLRGREVILVDDVITTGATMAAAAALVREEGGRISAGCALCVTPRRDPLFAERRLD